MKNRFTPKSKLKQDANTGEFDLSYWKEYEIGNKWHLQAKFLFFTNLFLKVYSAQNLKKILL